jgi:hypothetical protein
MPDFCHRCAVATGNPKNSAISSQPCSSLLLTAFFAMTGEMPPVGTELSYMAPNPNETSGLYSSLAGCNIHDDLAMPHSPVRSPFSAWGTLSHCYQEHWRCGCVASPARLLRDLGESLLRPRTGGREDLPWDILRGQPAQAQRGSWFLRPAWRNGRAKGRRHQDNGRVLPSEPSFFGREYRKMPNHPAFSLASHNTSVGTPAVRTPDSSDGRASLLGRLRA